MRTKSKKLVAVIPAYNESQTIAKVLRGVSKYVDRIVLVDDGSSDETSERAKGNRVVLLRHAINLGQGAALQTGFEYAKAIGADVVITYDADGQFDPKDIARVVAPILKGKADVVLGSRFRGKAKDMPIMRNVILRLGIVFTYFFSNLNLTDTHNGFRAFSKEALGKIRIRHNGWAHASDILFQIGASKLKIIEVPVTVKYSQYSRKKGHSNWEAVRIPINLIVRSLFL